MILRSYEPAGVEHHVLEDICEIALKMRLLNMTIEWSKAYLVPYGQRTLCELGNTLGEPLVPVRQKVFSRPGGQLFLGSGDPRLRCVNRQAQ